MGLYIKRVGVSEQCADWTLPVKKDICVAKRNYMKKIYHLSTCTTCKRILEEVKAKENGFVLQDIKTEKITPAQLEEMHALAGTYEALFSRRSQKYRPMGLHEKELTENDYRDLILQEYSFLKRPVAIVGKQIFVGSDKKAVEGLTAAATK